MFDGSQKNTNTFIFDKKEPKRKPKAILVRLAMIFGFETVMDPNFCAPKKCLLGIIVTSLPGLDFDRSVCMAAICYNDPIPTISLRITPFA